MAGARKIRRGILLALGAGTLGLLGAAATLDWWLPPLGERFAGDLSYARRTTDAGRTIAWRRVQWRGDGLVVRADEATVSAPWRLIRRGRVDATVSGWRVDITEAERAGATEPDPSGPPMGWPEVWRLLEEIGGHLEKRVGEVVLSDGRVHVAGEEIEIARFALRGGAAEGTVAWRGQEVAFSFALPSGEATLRHEAEEADLRARLGAQEIAGELTWAGNRAEFSAAGFSAGAGDWIPGAFSLTGKNWRVPVDRLGAAAEYYDDLRGDFAVNGAGGNASVTVNAAAIPRDESLPPLRIMVAGEASESRVRVERLEVDAPAAKARLGAPVEWSAANGWHAPESADFTVSADLATLSGGVVQGKLEGAVRRRGERVRWDARVTEGAWNDVRDVAASLKGESDLIATTVEAVELTIGHETRIGLSGRILHADGGRLEVGELRGDVAAATLGPWLPDGLALGRIALSATATGAFTDLRIVAGGQVNEIAYDDWRVARLEAEASGSMATGWNITTTATRGTARLELAGAYGDDVLKLERVRWVRGDGVELVLRETGEAGVERVRLDLEGADERRLAVDWTKAGETSVTVNSWDTSWLEDWREGEAWPTVAVRSLMVTGRVGADEMIEGRGSLDMVWRRGEEPELWARFAGEADAGGLLVRELAAGQGAEVLASGSGRAPWRARLGDTPGLVAAESGEWSLRLDSRPEATVWDALAKAAGVALERPALALALTGPARAPNGTVAFEADRIGLNGEGLPTGGLDLRALRLETVVTAGEISIPVLRAEVDGQRVEADGRLPLGGDDWESLRDKPFVWLQNNAEARLRLPEAQVAALARYLPRLLAPTGTVEAELSLSKGARLDGRVVLRGGGTRPLGDFGVLHEIDLDLVMAGMEMRVARATARAGGQEVSITGGARRVPDKLPVLDLAVKAERFPFVRKPGLILRGDLDLTVKTNEGTGRTRVGGSVVLRDSLVLADIRPLLAASGGGTASAPRGRPPYFSVDTQPVADWELGVTLRGDQFVRIRTPVFEGRGTAAFALDGTLREPRISGEFTVDPGRILFPFATFSVQEGALRILRNDPYSVRLDFRASGRRLGYDLRLEIDGTSDAPQLRLYSTPALDAETLLLMITAGVAPSDGQTAGAGQRLAAVGAYVGRDLLRTLGFAGSDEERLTLRSGDQVSRAGRETYGFEFRVTDRWSLVGDYDEFDAYNMGVRRRFRAKEPEPRAEAEGGAVPALPGTGAIEVKTEETP